MKNIEIILSISGTALGFMVTALTFIAKFIKSAKAKRIAENVIKIGNAVIPYIEQAEKYVGYSGAEKKEYVMTKANQFAIDNGIAFNAGLIGEKIEELVSLTKEVNARNKGCGNNGTYATLPVPMPVVNPQSVPAPHTVSMPVFNPQVIPAPNIPSP